MRVERRGAVDLLTHDRIGLAHDRQTLGRHVADDAHRQTRPRKRLARDDVLGQAEHAAQRAHFVFKERSQRFDQFEIHVFGKSADVVMRLDLVPGFAPRRLRLDHVGIQRPLHEKFHAGNLGRFFFEQPDEFVPDDHALALGILNAGQFAEKPFARVHRHDVEMQHVAKRREHLRGFVLAKQSVVHEDARQLFADGPRDERRRHRRIHAARKRADHLVGADPRANLLDRAVHERLHLPALRYSGHAPQEVFEDAAPVLGVHHLWMELHGVDASRRIAHRRASAAIGARQVLEPGRELDDRVAVRHPDTRPFRHAGKQRRRRPRHLQRRRPVLGMIEFDQFEVQMPRDQLHPVANPQNGDTAVQNRRIHVGRLGHERALRSARQDDGRGIARRQRLPRHVVRDDLAIDAQLARPPRDQLAVLGAEVENEDRRRHCVPRPRSWRPRAPRRSWVRSRSPARSPRSGRCPLCRSRTWRARAAPVP